MTTPDGHPFADDLFTALNEQGKRFVIKPEEITIVRDADTHEVVAYIWEPPRAP